LRLLIISGLSGSGKSSALHMLEDLDYYCVDNIPSTLFETLVAELRGSDDPKFEHCAIGFDARPDPEDIVRVSALVPSIRESNVQCEVLFLTSSADVLLKRYSETRRKHPFSGQGLSLADSIGFERKLLAPLCDIADLIIDTSRLSVHRLRETIRERVAGRTGSNLALQFESFGFKHGVPADADFVLHPSVLRFVEDIKAFLERWIPEIRKGNRSYLTIAVGCTGGQHRSVYVAETLATHFRSQYESVLIRHAELSR
jgi:UPF0042 nucleotide-binding protein